MNYKFLSAFALVCSMYTDIKAVDRSPSVAEPQVVPAQVAPVGLKIGFVDVGYVLGMLPEAKKNNIEIQSFQKQLDNEVQTKFNLLQEQVNKFQQEVDTLTNDQKRKKGMELHKMETEIRVLDEARSGKMAAKYKEVMQPLHDKMQAIINKIVEEGKYDVVFNKNTDAGPVILFGRKEFDLSDLVLEKLKEMVLRAPERPVVGAQQPSAKASAPAKPGKPASPGKKK